VMCGSTVHCMASTGTSAFLVVYHSHTPDGRGPSGDRPRPEQPQLPPASTLKAMHHGAVLLADIALAQRGDSKVQ
jgi:hypothetical protein